MEEEVEQTLLEDGEIFDSDDGYTPLERPSNYAAPPAVQQQKPLLEVDSETEEDEPLTSSNSDSDDRAHTKRPKLKPKPRPAKKTPANSRYDIWSEKAQEDVLAETLNFCDVTQKDRSRSVESYDYTLSYRYNNKRTRDDRKNPNKRHTNRSPNREKDKGQQEQQQKPRYIQALTVDPSNTPAEIATDIANKLFEENEEIVQKVVQVFGVERSMEVFAETRRIEEEGGMLILNMSRRRTPGGVFLYLVRTHDHITKKQRDEIFDFDRQKQRAASKSRQKKKLQKMKEDIAAARAKTLPDLLTRAEVMAPRVNNNRNSDESDVGNPPNTPETEEQPGNSSDGMDGKEAAGNSQGRKLQTYENDLFGFDNVQDMDLF